MKWIDVNIELPKEDNKRYGLAVLCHYITHRTDKRTFYNIGILYYKQGKFYYGFVGNVEKKVTHWMHLPKKPKLKNK